MWVPSHFISHTLQILKKLYSNKYITKRQKISYFLTYLKIKSLYLPMIRNKRKLNLFGMHVEFPDIKTLMIALSIFIHFTYFFDKKKLRGNPKVIVDIGSNIGLSTLFFKSFYPDAKIFAFEPNPEAYMYANRNIRANDTTNIKLFNYAVSNYSGETKLYSPSVEAAHVGSSIFKAKSDIKDFNLGKVKVRKLSEIIKKHKIKKIDILKLDCEGAESSIIQDIEKFLNKINFIVMEFHYDVNLIKNNSLSKILAIFEKKNFIFLIKSDPKIMKNNNYTMYIYAINKNIKKPLRECIYN